MNAAKAPTPNLDIQSAAASEPSTSSQSGGASSPSPQTPLLAGRQRTHIEQSDGGSSSISSHKNQEFSSEWWLVVLTAVLAFVTYRLVVETRRLVAETASTSARQAKEVAESLAISKKAAAAAELSARAMIGIELPIVRAIPGDLVIVDARITTTSGPWNGFTLDNQPPGRYSAVNRFTFQNHGRTPAFPTHLSLGWSVCERLPESPSYVLTEPLSHAIVIKSNDDIELKVGLAIALSEQQLTEARSDTSWLWVYGCLTYMDFLLEQREARFCWRFARRSAHATYRFASDGNPPEAYKRSM